MNRPPSFSFPVSAWDTPAGFLFWPVYTFEIWPIIVIRRLIPAM